MKPLSSRIFRALFAILAALAVIQVFLAIKLYSLGRGINHTGIIMTLTVVMFLIIIRRRAAKK